MSGSAVEVPPGSGNFSHGPHREGVSSGQGLLPRPLRVAFVSHYAHLRMGGQRSMALLIEHLDRRLVEPIAICPAPGELSDYFRAIGCPVVHVPLHPIKPRTIR